MPERPREHIVETVSRIEFRRLVAERGWVVRSVDNPDYGLDDLVEIFEDGKATGLLFYVQARGTDQADLHKALAVRVKAKQQAYFNAVEHPVLVVRYQGESRRLFARWFHRFDPHPRRGGETLRLHESDELLDENLGGLADEVRLYRAVSSAAVAWPLAVKVSSAGRHQARDAVLAMFAIAGGKQRYARFVAADEAQGVVGITVDLRVNEVEVHAGRSSLTLHGHVDELDLEDVAADAVLAVGVVLGMLEHLDAAAVLIAAAAAKAPAFEGELLWKAVGALARGRRIGDALVVGRALAEQDRRTTAAFVVGPVALATSELMSDEELAGVAAFDESLADAAEQAGNAKEAAAISYSLGNWLFAVRYDWVAALTAYERAAALDPTYWDRGYFVHERAGALFECSRYEESAAAYQDVMDRGMGNQRTLARLGDALLFAGRYSDASTTFERYMTEPVPSEPVWELKAAFARFLVSRGYEKQERDEEGAHALSVEADGIDALASRVAKCKEALEHDAMCSPAWQLLARTGAPTEPVGVAAMVYGALTLRHPTMWAAALIVLMDAREEGLARAATAHALIDNGPSFPDAIRQAEPFFESESVEAALSLAQEIERSMVKPDRGFTLRVPSPDGGVIEYAAQPPIG
jgi:tetratricopeptide (TPR) repeat protein